jgi:hypothetical protein
MLWWPSTGQLPLINPKSYNLCWIRHLTISFKNQLMSNEGSRSLLWHSKSHSARHVLRVVHVTKAALLHLNNPFFKVTLPRLELITLALISFVRSGLWPCYLKLNWCPIRDKPKRFMAFEITPPQGMFYPCE